MWPLVYRFLLFFAAPFVRLRLRRRARQEPAYGERIEERFGAVPATRKTHAMEHEGECVEHC